MTLYLHSENKSFFSNDLLSLAFIKLSNVSDHFGPPCTNNTNNTTKLITKNGGSEF